MPAEGQWIPAGEPGSHWAAAHANGDQGEYVGRRRAPEEAEPLHGKHSAAGEEPPEPPAAPEAPVESDADGGAHTGGQSVAELLARLHAAPSGGGRRRRRED
ncbi:hypothetical protein [Mycolicibacterium austroafricanum]|uniref:hypothetical protein n=1 Tax=Mycolicibacterium austroafricanum TaxID=39687 RepID=UPI001CA3749F|nr:hypothetical protein [Mycolicibacterium austroafricanum]QZT62403.1 hypothetical protein JN085_26545 [Mycolicibacterium austroafricanum]